MTTQSWSTRIRHDSDALFREWGAEFNSFLAAAGLVQTADTGQINWATATRAAVNSNAGYEVWRLADTQQATAPIFFRIDYGTGSNASAPRMLFTVGTGSNGSGTITGTALTAATVTANGNSAQTTDTARNSYMCHTDGFFGFYWKAGALLVSECCFFIARTVDANGDPTATGALVIWSNQSARASQALRFAATAVAYTARTNATAMQICVWPQTPASSVVGSDLQAALAFTITPRVEPLLAICGVLDAEFAPGVTFTATQVGVTPHTYIALPTAAATFADANGTLKMAMLWE